MARERLKPGTTGQVMLTPMLRVKGGKPVVLTIVGKRYVTKDGTAVQPDQWRATAYVRDKDGKRRKVEAVGSTRTLADQALKSKLGERHTPTTADIKPTTTVGELARLWLAHLATQGQVSTETLKLYRVTAARHVAPLALWDGADDKPTASTVEALHVNETNAGTVHGFLVGLIDAKTGKGRGSAKTARTVLRAMFELAVRNDAIKVNPVRQAERVSAPAKVVRDIERAKKGHLEAAEIAAVLTLAETDPWAKKRDLADLLHLLHMVGPRIGEALALRWDDIDLAAGVMTIGGQTVVRRSGEGLVIEDHGRTKDFEREVTLSASLVARLLARRVAQGANPLNLVFPTPAYGKRGGTTLRDVANTTKDVRKAFELAGHELPKGQGSHLFRHTLVTDLIAAGVPTREVSNQVGHRATRTTTDTYASQKVRASAASTIRE